MEGLKKLTDTLSYPARNINLFAAHNNFKGTLIGNSLCLIMIVIVA